MLASGPRWTRPMTVASGCTQAVGWISGAIPSSAQTAIRPRPPARCRRRPCPPSTPRRGCPGPPPRPPPAPAPRRGGAPALPPLRPPAGAARGGAPAGQDLDEEGGVVGDVRLVPAADPPVLGDRLHRADGLAGTAVDA